MNGNFVFAQYAPEAYAPKAYESAYSGVVVQRGSDGNPLGFVDHETGGVIYRYIDPSILNSLPNAFTEAFSSGKPTKIMGQTGATYVCTLPINCNLFNTSFEGNDCIIDMSTMQSDAVTPFVTQAIIFDYQSGSDNGPLTRRSKTKNFRNFELIGPGKTVANTKGLYTNGTRPGTINAPRVSLEHFYVHEFETGVGGKDVYYLSNLRDFSIYSCTYGIWQEAGSDSGECCSAKDGAIDICYTHFRCDDSSSEWSFDTVSFDYSRQWMLVTASARVNFNNCHVENRAKNLVFDNNNYMLDGSGSDARAPVAGKDCFIDLDADGTLVTVTNTTLNANNSGGNGPYDWYRLIYVRNAGTRLVFKNCYTDNFLNKANLLYSGPGTVVPGFISRIASNPSMPTRLNNESRNNLYCDMDFTGALGKQQQWWIYLDTNSTTPTNRYTATNGTIAIATPAVGNASGTACTITGEVMTVGGSVTNLFVRDMVLTGTGVTANTRIIGQLTGTTGLAGTYLVDKSQTVASTTITGTIGKALLVSKAVATTGGVGTFTVALIAPITPNMRISHNFLTMIPSASGINTGTITVTNQFCRMSESLDANGLPQITEIFTQQRFKTIDCATLAKDTWSEFVLEPWANPPDAYAGATHSLILVSCASASAIGGIYFARPHGSVHSFG